MFNIVKKSIEWGGRTLELETGKVARQADGAVMIKYGETTLLCVATAAKSAKVGLDFFPLTCVYQEKAFAAGKIPGGFFKREGRPSEKETLVSRLMDRPLRPLFQEGFKNETQVICTVLTHDMENDPDVVSLVGAAAALAISGIPFNGPVAAARVAYIGDEYVLNPSVGFGEESDLDIVIAGTESSVMMVESEAKELSEEVMLGAVKFAHEGMQPVIELIKEFAAECGKQRWEVAAVEEGNAELKEQVVAIAEAPLREAYAVVDKQDRVAKISAAKDALAATLLEKNDELDGDALKKIVKKLEQKIVRGNLLDNAIRIDGRSPADIRDIIPEIGILPGTHGSSLFTRGETQALVVTTLGTGQDEQRIDALDGDVTEHFMLHYNFPPYSVGEVSFLRGPGRREIGHGKLAWRALRAIMPSQEDFPYTIRIVSEITESNGSSSMATVCGSSLAMMDAGVPLKRPVAGIAMGLVKDGDKYVILSDIMGDEDHLGDMDFKVAGTSKGITSLQMDIKIQGITPEIMSEALTQAHAGRKHILDKMAEAIENSNDDVKENAPKITSINIPTEKIREVIGAGGKIIREICEVSGAKVDINDDGLIKVAAVDTKSADIALAMIKEIVTDPEVGEIYNDCKVIKIVDFGAFVEFMGKSQGLVHISELEDRRVEKVTDIISEGDLVKVKLIGIDRQGKVKLSMKSVDQESGEDISDTLTQRPPRKNFN